MRDPLKTPRDNPKNTIKILKVRNTLFKSRANGLPLHKCLFL